jgi:hypothetical protein
VESGGLVAAVVVENFSHVPPTPFFVIPIPIAVPTTAPTIVPTPLFHCPL